MAFKVLRPIHTFQPGDEVNASDFPVGASMERLVNLGALRPLEGEPIEIKPTDLEGWKQLAEHRGKKIKDLETAHPDSAAPAKLAEAEKEIERLNTLVTDLKTQIDELGREAAENEHAMRSGSAATAPDGLDSLSYADVKTKATELGIPSVGVKKEELVKQIREKLAAPAG